MPNVKIFKDIDNLDVLDVYDNIFIEDDNNRKESLKHIINIAHEQIKKTKNNSKIIHKYWHFAKYHNRKIKEYSLDEKEFKILIKPK